MNFVLKWISILSFFAMISCNNNPPPPENNNKQEEPPTVKEDTKPSDKTHNLNDCKEAIQSSYNMGECFYLLPTLKHGESFTAHYQDTLNIQTQGVTVGKGKWICKNGAFYQLESPVCLTCSPGRNLEYCQTELESLRRNLN